MKFGVLALDYDGTIAQGGVLAPGIKPAIAEARARGIVVIIATGRILSDLRGLCGDLSFVDAVVAENGAVLAFPNGQTRILGRLPPQGFFDELQRRGVAFRSGQCIVEAEASAAPAILAAIRELQLPLVILFNRGRLMLLGQAISKGTGLRDALHILRLSPHNAIAIGDAENDHALLAECEVAVAVSWGSPTLQAEADQVVNGDGPSAVAAYIRWATTKSRLPAGRAGRHPLRLGTAHDGQAVTRDVSGVNALIVGESQSGKSWATGLVCEQLIIQGYTLCVIDPEGDYGGLESLPGVLVLGAADDRPPDMAEVAHAIQHFDLSVVVDLSRVHLQEKIEYMKALLPMLASIRRTTGLPHRIVVDEAHYFLHAETGNPLLDLELNAYTLVTYRPSDLAPEIRSAIDLVIAKRLTNVLEFETLLAIASNTNNAPESMAALSGLPRDEAFVLTRQAGGQLRRFKLLPRLTAHVRHREKYYDFEVVPDQAFVFTETGSTIGSSARSLKQFAALLQVCPANSAGDYARRGDFSRWVGDVFQDHPLASDIRKVEQRFRLSQLEDVRQPIASLIQERYVAPQEATLGSEHVVAPVIAVEASTSRATEGTA
jgi:hydroxymethylpyrimidine pyrophosphatase-like HAD family hydrolase